MNFNPIAIVRNLMRSEECQALSACDALTIWARILPFEELRSEPFVCLVGLENIHSVAFRIEERGKPSDIRYVHRFAG